jgi:aminomethyltransferase
LCARRRDNDLRRAPGNRRAGTEGAPDQPHVAAGGAGLSGQGNEGPEMTETTTELLRTPLHDLHLELGARMVPFAGYEMPVQYPAGVLAEHLHTRTAAGLFDVSHMGQVILGGRGAAAALEGLVPVDVQGLAKGRQRYALFTNDAGGIVDDLMVANRGDHLLLVVNAARKAADLAHLTAHLPGVEGVTDRALLALQGPAAEAALGALVPGVAAMRFMDVAVLDWQGEALWISRSGYTGEDGFEISVPEGRAVDLARALLARPGVMPIGLGARDSLRLEAGMPLYGHDIDEATTPVEAGLAWAIQKVRRAGGDRAGGFPGAGVILDQLATGPRRLRAGLLPEGRAPMREGTALFAAPDAPEPVGHVTSGGFGPSLGAPLAMGYLPAGLAAPGTTVWGEVRGKRLPARTVPLPFRPSTYRK